jgi:transcriptional regulator with XRE-family HTH domain
MAERMEGPELMATLTVLGWTISEFASRLGVSTDTVRQLVRNQRPIPANLAAALRGAAAWVALYPLPRLPDRRSERHVRGRYKPRAPKAD